MSTFSYWELFNFTLNLALSSPSLAFSLSTQMTPYKEILGLTSKPGFNQMSSQGRSNNPKTRPSEFFRIEQNIAGSNSTGISQFEGSTYASNPIEHSSSLAFARSVHSNESSLIAAPHPKTTASLNSRTNQSPMTAMATRNIEMSPRPMQHNNLRNRSGYTASPSRPFKKPSTLAGRAEMLKTKTSSRMHLWKKKESIRNPNSSITESDRRSGALRLRPRGISKLNAPGSQLSKLRSSEKSGQNQSQYVKGTDRRVRNLHSAVAVNRGAKSGSSKICLKAPAKTPLGAGRKPCSSTIRIARKNVSNDQDSSIRSQQSKLHLSSQNEAKRKEHPNLAHMDISSHRRPSMSAYELEMMTALRSKIEKWNDFQNSWKRHYHREDNSQQNDDCSSEVSLLCPTDEESNKSSIDSCEKFLHYLQESQDQKRTMTSIAHSGQNHNSWTAMPSTAMPSTTMSSTTMSNTAMSSTAPPKLDNGTYQPSLLKGPCRGQCLHFRIQQACHSYLGGAPERNTLNRFIGSDLCEYEWCEVSAQMFPFVITE